MLLCSKLFRIKRPIGYKDQFWQAWGGLLKRNPLYFKPVSTVASPSHCSVSVCSVLCVYWLSKHLFLSHMRMKFSPKVSRSSWDDDETTVPWQVSISSSTLIRSRLCLLCIDQVKLFDDLNPVDPKMQLSSSSSQLLVDSWMIYILNIVHIYSDLYSQSRLNRHPLGMLKVLL